MTVHPLIDRSNAREARQAKDFRTAAAALTGEALAEEYRQEVARAPSRREAGKRYLGVHPKKPPDAQRSGRDEEHLGMALVSWARGQQSGLELPGGGELLPVDYHVPLFTARPARDAVDDRNEGVDHLGLVGLGPDDRLAVAVLKYVPPDGTRSGTGETPLHLFLNGLAHAAFADANREALGEEIAKLCGRAPADAPPRLVLLATPAYWQLCRKREAQKGAAWIKELERLARECEQACGIGVLFLSLALEGNPGWEYGEAGPTLVGAPSLGPAWEALAGRVRPRVRTRSRKTTALRDELVEADLSRPVRSYGITESYSSGDRIQHSTLGMGVVQGPAGPGKIHVLFGDRKTLLVHERAPTSS